MYNDYYRVLFIVLSLCYSLSHPSYIDESSLQAKPVIPGIHLDPIKQVGGACYHNNPTFNTPI